MHKLYYNVAIANKRTVIRTIEALKFYAKELECLNSTYLSVYPHFPQLYSYRTRHSTKPSFVLTEVGSESSKSNTHIHYKKVGKAFSFIQTVELLNFYHPQTKSHSTISHSIRTNPVIFIKIICIIGENKV